MNIKTDTKSKIIYAAVKLFPELGYEKTSMRRIAEEVGITKPALYYYYKNKDELFKSIVDFGNNFSIQRLTEICDKDLPIEQKLKELVWIKFSFMDEMEEVRRFSGWLTTDGLKYLAKFDLDQEINEQLSIIYQIISNAKDNGELRVDLEEEAFIFLLFGAANLYIHRHFILNKDEITKDKIDRLIDTLLSDARNN